MEDGRISSLERNAEEGSNYAKKLRSRFGKESYFKLLRDSLSGIFGSDCIHFLSPYNSPIYIVFSEQIQAELKRGLKSMKSLLAEGEKKYLTSQLDEFTKTLRDIFTKGVKAGCLPVLLEVALKRWLKVQMPSKRSTPVHKKFNLSLQFISKGMIRDNKAQRKVSRFLRKALPIPVSLSGIKLKDFSDFMENADFFADVGKILTDYFISPVKIESQQFDYGDIQEKIKSTQVSIKKNVVKKIENLFRSAEKQSIKSLYRSINDILKYINSGEVKIRALKSKLSKLRSIADAEVVEIPDIFRYFEPDLGRKLSENMDQSVAVLRHKLRTAPNSFLTHSLLGRKPDYEKVLEWFIDKYNEVFLPTVGELIFEEIVKVFPESDNNSLEEARWIGLLARKEDPPAVFFIPQIDRKVSRKKKIMRDYMETVSVMIYDIRGSSIMGEKLLNSEMEDKIRNEFQRELLKAVEDTGGFFVKDTGDGGIVLFSEGGSDLYFRELSVSGEKERNIDEKEIKLKASMDSATRAIRCGKKMIDYAERFVRKNLKRYQEWFKDFDEKEIGFGGATYERLPPEYRKIFQIGIGVASGKPGKDVSLGINVLGRLDLTGNLVRRANMYSTVHHPDRSVLLIGAATMFNFLLQVNSFKSSEENGTIEKSSYVSKPKELRQEVIRWMEGLSGNYFIRDYKVSLERIDYLLDDKYEKEEVEIAEESLSLKKEGPYYDKKVGTERVLYEVIPEKRS